MQTVKIQKNPTNPMINVQMMGVNINPLTVEALHGVMKQEIEESGKAIISNHNLHSLYLYHHQEEMRRFYQLCKYVHLDGMALVFLGKFLGCSLERRQRVTYVDWIIPLAEEASKQNWRIFFLGSRPGVGEEAAAMLIKKFPKLQIRTAHGYFNTENHFESRAVIRQINDFQPHIVMVGMGMPRQELWVLENFSEINCNIILTAGAVMDYVANAVRTPPRWMGRVGLEWLFRLISEPKRLWKRYLVEPWYILGLFLLEITKRMRR